MRATTSTDYRKRTHPARVPLRFDCDCDSKADRPSQTKACEEYRTTHNQQSNVGSVPPVAVANNPDVEPGDGQLWRVVGGGHTGGIVVKMDRDLRSNEAMYRLKNGATVEQIELIGDRLHYKRIRGDGPDFGWVSVHYKGQELLRKFGTPKEPEE